MTGNKILHALAVVAVLAFPTAALAQAQPYWWYDNAQTQQLNQNQRRFFEALRTLNLSEDQREQIRNIVSNRPDDRADVQYMQREIRAILTPDQRRQLNAELRGYNGQYPGGYNGQYPGGYNGQYPGGYNGQYPGGYYPGPYNGQYPGGYGPGSNAQLNGVVSSFSPFNLYLQNGTHVELHQGTVINPTGTTLSPGMRVQVFGYWNSDGTYHADQINVIRY